ncbi:MAG: response regulator [bacterium]|nr:response regulator [bacterium]
MKVLIVEDDFTSRLLLQEMLKEFGTTHVAVNGKEAVEAVRIAVKSDEPYDLICLDIMMPEMDGQTALKEIRKIEEERGIFSSDGSKIIMTTALDKIESVITAYKGLCDGYLTKPIDKTKLLDNLKQLNLISE